MVQLTPGGQVAMAILPAETSFPTGQPDQKANLGKVRGGRLGWVGRGEERRGVAFIPQASPPRGRRLLSGWEAPRLSTSSSTRLSAKGRSAAGGRRGASERFGPGLAR